MKKLIVLMLALFCSLPVLATEKPTQHLKLEDVTSMRDAKEIFLGKTHEIMEKRDIGLKEAAEIHVITYTLEKGIAYFAENLTGQKQSIAKEMAIVVEDIHLTSENNRLDQLKAHVDKYFGLVDKFIFGT